VFDLYRIQHHAAVSDKKIKESVWDAKGDRETSFQRFVFPEIPERVFVQHSIGNKTSE